MPRYAICAAIAIGVAACSRSNAAQREGWRWTVREAESITVIRGTPVNVRSCRGVGENDSGRFRGFKCVAGTRLETDPVDTVAVFYELRPTGSFEGSRSRYVLTKVRFVGGPGIP
jgi:hypothetical protein